ncbi:MAG: AMP-binding protein [Lachnospiraceae bacterium]|nr:AMP-binding protein [Lachnospiraceae bacterium]
MAETYETLWNLMKTWKGVERPALSFENQGGDPRTLSYNELYEKVCAAAAATRHTQTPQPFSCVKTPENLIDLFANLIVGNDLLMLDEKGDNPGVFLDPVPDLDPALPGCTFTEGVPEGHTLFFTSGTTSKSKAVVLSTRALLAACKNGQTLAPCHPGDTILAILPLSHVFGFICSFLWGLTYGACIALGRSIREIFLDPGYFKPTIISAVPAMMDVFIRGKCLNPELRLVILGAAPAKPAIMQALSDMGIEAHLGYGLTETASGIALHTDDPDPLAFTPCPGCTFSIEEDGEISVVTDSCMDGYLGADSSDTLRNGRLYTGDFGFLDEAGHLHVTGRKKDVIVLPNGTKIFLPEYETELMAVLQFEDIAVKDADGRIILFVGGPLPAHLSKEAVSSAVDSFNLRKPRDQQIGSVVYTDNALPRTATGKVMRYMLHASL